VTRLWIHLNQEWC